METVVMDTRVDSLRVEELHLGSEACDAFVRGAAGGSIYHLSGIQRVITRTFGHKSIYLAARTGSEIRGVLPLVHMRSRFFGNFLVSVPFFNYGGVCADSPEAEEALLGSAIRIAERIRAAHIELRHSRRTFPELENKSHKVSLILDLPEDDEALWSAFKSKLRSQIRKPGKEGVEARIGGAELLKDFYEVFSVNMRDLGTPVYSRNLFANMLSEFPKNTWIVAAYLRGKPIAAGFLLGHGDTVEIPWASSLRSHNRVAANMLVYWEALKLAISNGYGKFDFGRSTPEEGTYKFKAQWGAKPHPLYWEYWLTQGGPLPNLSPSNSKFQTAINLWQKLPLAVTRVLGPTIVRNIP